MNTTHPWYVAVDDTTVGPAPTELVIRGIEHRKIPPEALVCPVGTATWTPLASVSVFHAAVVRSYPPPPPDSEEARSWLQHGFRFPSLGALPQFSGLAADSGDADWDSDTAPTAPPSAVARVSMVEVEVEADLEPEVIETVRAGAPSELELDVDVMLELAAEGGPAIDWSERFQSYFIVGDEVELPEQQALLDSLAHASAETFRHDEALWNLALCLAFGSDAVGEAAARTFFSTVADHDSEDRLAWMSRTLLGQGFVPSGIPTAAGRRACQRLRSSCPPALTRRLPHDLQ
jgi:GYF domain 2